MENHSHRMFEAAVRVDKLIWIPGIAAQSTEDFDEFIADELCDANQVLEVLPWLKAWTEGVGDDVEIIIGEFAQKKTNGFFAQISTPIPQGFFGSGHSYSWGYTQMRWVYAETMDALVAIAEEFAAEVVQREKAKASNERAKKQKAET